MGGRRSPALDLARDRDRAGRRRAGDPGRGAGPDDRRRGPAVERRLQARPAARRAGRRQRRAVKGEGDPPRHPALGQRGFIYLTRVAWAGTSVEEAVLPTRLQGAFEAPPSLVARPSLLGPGGAAPFRLVRGVAHSHLCCAPSVRSMCSPPRPTSATRSPSCSTRTGSPTRTWRGSPAGRTCPRPPSSSRRTRTAPTTGSGSSPP